MTWIASTLNFMRARPVWDNVFREATSNNTPHVLIVRNKDEAIDQGIVQFGNTLLYFGSGVLLDRLVRAAVKVKKTPIPKPVKPFFNLMKSFAIYAISASTVLATPQLRNYVTTLRTGTTEYADMVGEKKRHALSKEERKAKAAPFIKQFWKTLGIGAALSAAFLTTAAVGVKSLKNTPKFLKKVHNVLGLKDGKYENFKPHLAALFWTLPTYGGFFAAARDLYEVKELMLRFGAFLFAFFILPHTVENTIDKFTSKMKPSKILGPAKNIGYVGKLVSSIIFCGSIPSLVNIMLTRQRVKRDKEQALLDAQKPPVPVAKYNNPAQWQTHMFNQFAVANQKHTP